MSSVNVTTDFLPLKEIAAAAPCALLKPVEELHWQCSCGGVAFRFSNTRGLYCIGCGAPQPLRVTGVPNE